MWLALSFVMIVELVILLTAERDAGNLPMLVNSVGLLVLCVLTWRGIPWSRWFLIVFLVWRVAQIGIAVSSSFGPGDHRIGGVLMLIMLYVAAGVVAASPLGRSRMRASPNARG